MPRVSAQQLEKASLRLGEAVIDPSRWSLLMDDICQAINALGAALLQSDGPANDVPITSPVRDGFSVYFREGWHKRDLRARAVPLLLSGVPVCSDEDVTTPEEMRTHPYFNELIYPVGFHWWAAVGFRAGPAHWALAIQRTKREGQFGEEEKRLLARLSLQLTETATLSTAIGRIALTSGMNALAEVRSPAVAVDRFGLTLGANAAMDELLGEDIRIKANRLAVADPEAKKAVERLIARLVAGGDGAMPEQIVVRRIANSPVILRVLPVPPAAQSPFLGARAILTFTPLEPKPRPPAALLVEAFELTPAEARLAAALADGTNLEQAANALGITRETARNQLKSVFAKTGTHRQAELVALLARL